MKFEECSKFSLAIMLLTAVYACNHIADQQKYAGTALDTSTVDTTKFNKEYLDYSTVKINGVLTVDGKYSAYLKILGKPDSVVNMGPDDDCPMYMEPYQEAYAKGTMFYIVNDTANFQKIDFRESPDFELHTPAITLNSKTTLQDIQKLYPRAVSAISPIKYYHVPARFINLSPAKEYVDQYWILFFEGDKLIAVEMGEDC
jgi:hypothetical protein